LRLGLGPQYWCAQLGVLPLSWLGRGWSHVNVVVCILVVIGNGCVSVVFGLNNGRVGGFFGFVVAVVRFDRMLVLPPPLLRLLLRLRSL
jgi:hypothetical protein